MELNIFYSEMDFSSEQRRIEFLGLLQELILNKFDDTSDYNVHFFGSFVTKDFLSGKSDLDIGIFCLDYDKCNSINFFLTEILQKITDIKFDIICITEYIPNNFVYYSVLASTYRVTDYFPESTVRYLFSLYRQYLEYSSIRKRHRAFYKIKGGSL